MPLLPAAFQSVLPRFICLQDLLNASAQLNAGQENLASELRGVAARFDLKLQSIEKVRPPTAHLPPVRTLFLPTRRA